jgi:hypothetical protein
VAEPVNANFLKQLSRASLWAIIGGEGYLKWVWDAAAKKPAVIPCSIFEIAFDPYATDFQKARYVIHSKFMDVEQVHDIYGVKIKATGEETVDPMRTALLRGMGSTPVLNGVTVNELWYKPCRRYPKGLYVVGPVRTSWSRWPAALRPQAPALHADRLHRAARLGALHVAGQVPALGADAAQQVPRAAHHDPRGVRQPQVVDSGRA